MTHHLYTHPTGEKCIWLDGSNGWPGYWFVPLDAGGEGYACELEHEDTLRSYLAQGFSPRIHDVLEAAFLKLINDHNYAHAISNSPYGHVCGKDCWASTLAGRAPTIIYDVLNGKREARD